MGYNGTDAKSEGIFQFAYILRKRRISAALQHILGIEPYAILRPRRPVLYSFKAAAGGGITGTMAPTAANDTMAATGVIGIAGTMAPTAGADAMSADGAVASVGSMAASCGADAMAASGVVTDVGTMAATAANDTMGAVGFVGSITGTMAAQAGDDGMIASGTAGEDSGLVQSGMLANLGKLLGHR